MLISNEFVIAVAMYTAAVKCKSQQVESLYNAQRSTMHMLGRSLMGCPPPPHPTRPREAGREAFGRSIPVKTPLSLDGKNVSVIR